MKHFDLLNVFVLALSSMAGACFSSQTRDLFGGAILPNDNLYNYSWHLRQIEADWAWDISTGLNSFSTGFIDSGIDYYNFDLSPNLNGLLSIDCYGNHERNPLSYSSPHGTRVASIFGAANGFNHYVSGVTNLSSIVSLRTDEPNLPDTPNYQAVLFAIYHAIENSDEIIFLNSSVQMSNYSDSEINAITYLMNLYPGLMVLVAGNFNHDLDITNNSTAFQAFHNLPNVLVVGASDQNDEKCDFSNYGSNYVDLFAPGIDICSFPINPLTSEPELFRGTCAAAPLVSGTAALMKSVNPTLTPAQIKQLILNNVDIKSDLYNLCASHGRLNTFKAVKAAIPAIESFGQDVACVQSLPYDKQQFYRINLTPGIYHFESTDSLNMSGELFTDIKNSPVATSANTYGDFSFDYNCNYSQTVYLKVVNNDYGTDDYSIRITKTHTHLYDYSYSQYNLLKHRAYCQCGSYIHQLHVSDGIFNRCVLCGQDLNLPFDPLMSYTTIGNNSRLYSNGIVLLSDIDKSLIAIGQITYEELLGGIEI